MDLGVYARRSPPPGGHRRYCGEGAPIRSKQKPVPAAPELGSSAFFSIFFLLHGSLSNPALTWMIEFDEDMILDSVNYIIILLDFFQIFLR